VLGTRARRGGRRGCQTRGVGGAGDAREKAAVPDARYWGRGRRAGEGGRCQMRGVEGRGICAGEGGGARHAVLGSRARREGLSREERWAAVSDARVGDVGNARGKDGRAVSEARCYARVSGTRGGKMGGGVRGAVLGRRRRAGDGGGGASRAGWDVGDARGKAGGGRTRGA
jgi:hypothetical protein